MAGFASANQSIFHTRSLTSFLLILLVGCRQGAGTDVRIISHPFSFTAKFGRARLQDELSNYVKALSFADVAQRISSAVELIEHAFSWSLAG